MYKKIFWPLLLLTALCLSGCAGREKDGASVSEPDPGASPEFTFDWYHDKFALNEKIEEDSPLSIVDFYHWEQEGLNSENRFYGTDGRNFYTLGRDAEKEITLCTELLSYRPGEGEQRRVSLPLEELVEGSYCFVTAASMLSPGEFAVQVTCLGANDAGNLYPESYRILKINYQGEILSDVDMLPLYEAQGMLSENTLNPVADCLMDGEGCIYTRTGNGHIWITDAAGELLMVKDYGGDGRISIGNPVRSGDGKLIFPIRDGIEGIARLVWFDGQEGKEYELARLDDSSFQKLYAMSGSHLYYGTLEGILDWDTESGNRKLLFHYKDNGILNTSNIMLAFDGEGKPLLRVVSERYDTVYSLGERTGGQETVRIADLTSDPNRLPKSEMAGFFRANPLYSFSYEQAEKGTEEAFRDRILAEMTSGGGPDLLYLSREDLLLLQGKGMLADLGELLSADTLGELLPGALELGQMEGVQAGIPAEVYVHTVVTLPEIWDADSWSLGDILDLMKDPGRASSMEAILPTTGGGQLYYLALLDLGHSAFIDWENHSCCFSSEEFIELLKILKEHSLEETLVMDRDWELLLEGKCLGVVNYIQSFIFYEGTYDDYGEEIRATGFPSETGNGNYLRANGIFAVNANSIQKEAVAAFLEYALSEEGQSFCSYSNARKNMLTEDMVRYDEFGAWLLVGNNGSVQIATKKDGSTYIREYNAFLESCTALPDSYEQLRNIIEEEADAFFEGDKPAEEAARIIQERVQNYLDELR